MIPCTVNEEGSPGVPGLPQALQQLPPQTPGAMAFQEESPPVAARSHQVQTLAKQHILFSGKELSEPSKRQHAAAVEAGACNFLFAHHRPQDKFVHLHSLKPFGSPIMRFSFRVQVSRRTPVRLRRHCLSTWLVAGCCAACAEVDSASRPK